MNNVEQLQLEVLAKKYNEANIPQYMSYPTASWWKTMVNEQSVARRASARQISYVYLHFPFCRTACYYCMCYKRIPSDEGEIERYLSFLRQEIAQKTSAFGLDVLSAAKHIHWGGGTPTLLTCSQIEKTLQALSDHVCLADVQTLSIEAFPDERLVTEEKLKLLRSLGFTQISFGVQEFDPYIQQVINRHGKPDSVSRLVEASRSLGFRVAIDLCYGLPFQGLNELRRTVHEVVAMSPDRIASNPYAHYPIIFPRQRKIPTSSIPNSFIRVMLANLAQELLVASGYRKVGYDLYVKPTDPLYAAAKSRRVVRDFMGYSTEDSQEVMGFGLSAISHIANTYYHNVSDLDEYFDCINTKRLPIDYGKCHVLSMDDRIRSEIIRKDILSDFVIDIERHERRWGIDFNRYFSVEMEDLATLEANGLVDLRDPTKILVSPAGELFARHVAYSFDKYYSHQSQSRSNAEER